MKSSAIILVVGLIFVSGESAIAKNWTIAEGWEIVYWDVKRNVRRGINVVKASVAFVGMGNSGILDDVELCGHDIKSGRRACRQVDYGRVYKNRPITFQKNIGFTRYPIYNLYLREEN